MKSQSIFSLSEEIVKQSKQRSQFSKAHLCRASVKSFLCYLDSHEVADCKSFTFTELTPELLAEYERWLLDNGKAYNTVSTYMRNMQTLYNIAVERDLARYNRNMFKGRIKGYQCRHLRVADNNELQHLIETKTNMKENTEMTKAQRLFRLQILLCGIPFVDLVHLKVNDIIGNTLYYRRQKTGVCVRIRLSQEALMLIKKLSRKDASPNDLLLDILPSHSSMRTSSGWYRYQACLTQYNGTLHKLSQSLGLSKHITSYVARHTWADRAQRCSIDTKMIMELLGHSRITTTLYYLRQFDSDNIARAQQKVQKALFCEKDDATL